MCPFSQTNAPADDNKASPELPDSIVHEERAQLDAARSGKPPAGAAQMPPAPPPPPPPAPPMELNGLVQRSSGRSTVWLNQTPQQEPHNQVSGPSQLTLRLSNGQVVLLKPGQQYDPASGTVMEVRP